MNSLVGTRCSALCMLPAALQFLIVTWLNDDEICILSATCSLFRSLKSRRFRLPRDATLVAKIPRHLSYVPAASAVRKLSLESEPTATGSVNSCAHSNKTNLGIPRRPNDDGHCVIFDIVRTSFPNATDLYICNPSRLRRVHDADSRIRVKRLHIANKHVLSIHGYFPDGICLNVSQVVDFRLLESLEIEGCSIVEVTTLMARAMPVLTTCVLRDCSVSMLSLARVWHVVLDECHVLPGFVSGVDGAYMGRTIRGSNCTGFGTAYELSAFLELFARSVCFECAVFSGKAIQASAVDNIRRLTKKHMIPRAVTIAFEDGSIIVKSHNNNTSPLHDTFSKLAISK